jgi:hypothetical protein
LYRVGEPGIDQDGPTLVRALANEEEWAVHADHQGGRRVPMTTHLAKAATQADAPDPREELDAFSRFLKAKGEGLGQHGPMLSYQFWVQT